MRVSSGKVFNRARRGFTLIEMMVAVAIGAIIATGLYSIMVYALRIDKGVFHQQISLMRSRKIIERLNREIHLASATGFILTNASSNNTAPEVRFYTYPDTTTQHAFRITAGDGNFATPNDNQFVYDPDTNVNNDQIVLATMVSNSATPASGNIFQYSGVSGSPLRVNLRIGDPITTRANTSVRQTNDRFTGKGLQGVDVNLYVTPRNP